jgi:hypothetical protein
VLVVTFYTPSYADAVSRLRESATPYDVKITAVELPECGSWIANLLQRHRWLVKLRARERGPLLCVDADCTLHGSLEQLWPAAETYDFMSRQREAGDRYNAGVMLLADNERVAALLDRWNRYAQAFGRRYPTGDQRPLECAIASTAGLRVGELPVAYNCMPADVGKTGIIQHHKHSRELRVHRNWVKERLLEQTVVARTLSEANKPLAATAVALLLSPGATPPAELPLVAVQHVPSKELWSRILSVWTDDFGVLQQAMYMKAPVFAPTELAVGGTLGQRMREWRWQPQTISKWLRAYYVARSDVDLRPDGDMPAGPAAAALWHYRQRGVRCVHL